jgi:antitoxin HicB
MKSEAKRDLSYYQNLPYGVLLRKDEEGDWVARVEELPGCTAHGSTQAEALENLEEVKDAWLDDALAAGAAIPEPSSPETLPSGKWLQRVPRSLHKGLTEMANKEGVSLNQLVTSILAEAIGRRSLARGVILQTQPEEFHWTPLRWHHHRTPHLIDWEVKQQNPLFTVNLFDVLHSAISSLPNKMNEIDFKVIERAKKKELAFKA